MWASYSEIKTGKVEKPTICVPGPAGNRTVDNGSPAECEDHRWQNATALERSANDELYGTGTEEHLVEAKDDLWEQSGARGWSSHDILQSEVFHVADKWTGGTRVGERVAPKQPLEADTWAVLVYHSPRYLQKSCPLTHP